MSTPTSRLAELVRRKRGMTLPTMDMSRPAEMPAMDLTKPSAGDNITDDDIASVGEQPQQFPAFDALAPTPDPKGEAVAAIRGGAWGRLGDGGPGVDPDAGSVDVQPMEPTITERVPQDRHGQLMAALQRIGKAPDAQPETDPMLEARKADNARKLAAPDDSNSIPGMAAKTVMGAALPQQPPEAQLATRGAVAGAGAEARDGSEMSNAREADRKSHLTAGMELAARQLVGGITRTDVPQGIGAAASQVPAAQEAAKARRQALVEALNRTRQNRLDDSAIDLHSSEAEKNRRLPPEKSMPNEDLRKEDQRIRQEKVDLERAKLDRRKGVGVGPGETIQAGKPESIKDPGERAMVLGIASGKMDPPPGKAGLSIMKKVAQFAPDYDTVNHKAHVATTLKNANDPSLQALDVAYGHLSRAESHIPDNFDSPSANRIKQAIQNGTGDAGLTAFESDMLHSALESAKVLGESSEAGRQTIEHLLSPNASKAQILARLHETRALLAGRAEAVQRGQDRFAPKGTHIDFMPHGSQSTETPAPAGPPGPGYVRAKHKGVQGWFNASTNDFQAG